MHNLIRRKYVLLLSLKMPGCVFYCLKCYAEIQKKYTFTSITVHIVKLHIFKNNYLLTKTAKTCTLNLHKKVVLLVCFYRSHLLSVQLHCCWWKSFAIRSTLASKKTTFNFKVDLHYWITDFKTCALNTRCLPLLLVFFCFLFYAVDEHHIALHQVWAVRPLAHRGDYLVPWLPSYREGEVVFSNKLVDKYIAHHFHYSPPLSFAKSTHSPYA